MTRTILASALALAACSGEPTTITTNGSQDEMAAELANAAPVELPPALTESKTYRCKDNSLVYVDFFAGDKQANIRTMKDGPPTVLRAETAGEPRVAEGYSLTGGGESITLTVPGKASQTCSA